MKFLRQSTPATLDVGPFINPLDAKTHLTTLTTRVGGTKKNGVFEQFTPTSWGGGEGGHYAVGVDAVVVNTIGRLRVFFYWLGFGPDHLPVWEDYMVLSQEAYDAWFAAGAASTDEIEFKVEVERV